MLPGQEHPLQRSRLARPTTAAAVAEFLRLPLQGPDVPIVRFGSFPSQVRDAISFIQGPLSAGLVSPVVPSVVVAQEAVALTLGRLGYTVIVSEYPKYDLARALGALGEITGPTQIHHTAILSPGVELDEGVTIGPYAVLSGRIAVARGAHIGEHVRLMTDVQVGERCCIRSGCAIGGDAFNFGVGPDGASWRFPSFGGVRIEADADIGHNVVISRAIDGDTQIGRWVRINDSSMVGNAVMIDERAVVMAGCLIGGRARIGRASWIGMGAKILESVVIGERARIGMGAVVLDDVPPGVVAVGVPARVLRANL